MQQILAPFPYSHAQRPWIFLAGSIDQGNARNWQKEITTLLCKSAGTLLNPRRDDWNDTWVQDADTDPFRAQVLWELDAQESADIVLMYFSAESFAPITLLELGLLSQSGKLVVGCPHVFYRQGNVDMVCRRHHIPFVRTLEELASKVLKMAAQARREGEERKCSQP